MVSLQYLNDELVFFSVTLAAALSLTLNVHAYRVAAERRGGGVALGAMLPPKTCIAKTPAGR